MKKQLLTFLALFLMLGGVASAETWTCDNSSFGKAMYEVKDSEIILTFPNNDGRTFKITKDKRKVSIFGEMSNKKTNFDYDIYMDYGDKYVINRTLDALSGFSRSYTDKNCVIFN
jgi:hypothetical protein